LGKRDAAVAARPVLVFQATDAMRVFASFCKKKRFLFFVKEPNNVDY
jgi:hypothetical protein